MRRGQTALGAIALVAGAMVGSVVLATPAAAGFSQFEASAVLTGANEVGGGDPDGSGTAVVVIEPFGTQICFDLTVTGIATPTMAHIHDGDAGTNGPIVVDFEVATNGLDGCVTVAADLMQDILDDLDGFYVNVHNAAFTGGAIRDQLGLTATTTDDDLDGEDGELTLREAFVTANWADDSSTITLGADERYELTDCPPGMDADDDDTVTGDLDDTAGQGVVLEGNGSTIHQTCPNTRVLHHTSSETSGTLAVFETTISGGHAIGEDGGGINSGSRVALTDSAVFSNEAGGDGGGAWADQRIDVMRSYIGRNSATGSGGGLSAADVSVVHSTLHENQASVGGGISASTTSSVYGTFSGNNASFGDHLTVEELTSLASAYQLDHGPGTVCEVETSATSNGANHVSSATPGDCTFSGTGDVVSTADLGLRPIFPAGVLGPDTVLYPEPDSPLVDVLAFGDSSCAGTDQLDTPRAPDADHGCDAGAVELVPCTDVFTDVGTTHPFCTEIAWMGAVGVSTGTQPGPQYKPSPAVSRAAMSAFMYRLAGSPPFEPPSIPSFPDVSASHPFFAEIEWMNAEEITTGFSDDTYRPGAAVSRQAMAAFMYRLAGSPPFSPPGTPTFPDVSASNLFFLEIEWMNAEEITTGFSDDTYRPGAAVSRQAMAAFMYRLADGLLIGQTFSA